MEERTLLSLLLLLAVSGEAKIILSLLVNSSGLNQLWGGINNSFMIQGEHAYRSIFAIGYRLDR